MTAPFRRYYYAKDPATEKSIGGPWISIAELARAVVRYEKAGRPYRIAVIQAGQWTTLDPTEGEALVAHVDELRPSSSSSSRKKRPR